VAVDDCSADLAKDAVLMIAREYAAGHCRIRVYRRRRAAASTTAVATLLTAKSEWEVFTPNGRAKDVVARHGHVSSGRPLLHSAFM
jgi:hypothetical protein